MEVAKVTVCQCCSALSNYFFFEPCDISPIYNTRNGDTCLSVSQSGRIITREENAHAFHHLAERGYKQYRSRLLQSIFKTLLLVGNPRITVNDKRKWCFDKPRSDHNIYAFFQM